MSKTFEEFVIEATGKIYQNVSDCNELQAEELEKFLKDAIATELLTSQRSTIEIEGNRDKVTTNLASSLVAAGISRTGELEEDAIVEPIQMDFNRTRFGEAQRYVIDSEIDYLEGFSYEKRASMMYGKVRVHPELANPDELLRVGFATIDRKSGYNGNHTSRDKGYFEFVHEAWQMEEYKYKDLGLTDTPYYKVLKSIFDENNLHHYPLVARKALESIALFTFKLDNGLKTSVSEMQEMQRYCEASKIMGEDVEAIYHDDIRKVMKSYSERQKGTARVIERRWQ